MPKIKHPKGCKKRRKITSQGKGLRQRAGKSHLMSKKRGKGRRQLKKTRTAIGLPAKKLAKLLGT